MSPTRRDLFRRAAATVAAVSVAAIPTVPVVATKPSRLLVAFIFDDPVPYGMATVNGYLWIHWANWTRGEREHFLEVIEREFPVVAADVADHLEQRARPDEDEPNA